jgi:hypothetical protein
MDLLPCGVELKLDLCGEWTPLTTVARPVMFFQHRDRKPFGPRNRLYFIRGQTLICRYFPDVRQVLLKFGLGKAVHCGPLKKAMSLFLRA